MLLLVIVVVFLGVLIIGDPGRIDRDRPWLRVLTVGMIGVITVANAASAFALAVDIVNNNFAYTSNGKMLFLGGTAIWLTNIIAFARPSPSGTGSWIAAARLRGPGANGVALSAHASPIM